MRYPEIRCEVLPNGLTVLLCESQLAPVAEIQLWANVGSADERPFESGLAHFHEHMLFKGTKRRAVGAVAGDIEGAGGRINAFTSFDVTCYHATLPSDQLEVGVDVLTDALLHSTFVPEEIDREIEVVLEEIRRSEDSPTQVLGQAVFGECYREHPYRAPILGTRESVESFSRERVKAFYERWYTPDNLLAVAVGDFDAARLLEQLEAAFDGRPRGNVERSRTQEPPQTERRSVICARPFERVNMEISYPGVRLRDPDCAVIDLLAFILGNSESSRLNRRVKESEGLVDRIDAYSYTPMDPGMTSVSIGTDADRALDSIAAAVREIERLRIDAVSKEELERARINFLASEHFERESVTGMAQKLGSFQTTADDYREEARYLERIRNATPADLLRAARQHLAPERMTVGAVLGEADAPRLDDASIDAAIARGLEQTTRSLAMPAQKAKQREIHSYEMINGAQLYVMPRRSVPVVAARAAFMGGTLAEDESNAGITNFLSSVWLRGTRSHSTADFARVAENLAADVDGFSGRNSLGTTLECPVEALDPTLELFAELLLEPAFDLAEIERERSDTLAAIERREDRLAQLAYLLFAETHFRKHPYRLASLGSAESVRSFDADLLRAHHARLIRGENMAVAIVGDVDPDSVAARFSAQLTAIPSGGFEAPSPPLEAAPSEIREAELRKDRAQAHLVIGFRGVTISDPDRFTLEVIVQLLAGQGGRLFLELRDRRSLAYTVSANNSEGVAPGHFTVYIATAPEKLDEARAGMFEELEKLLQQAPSDEELERAKRYLIGNHAIGLQRNAAHAGLISLNSLYGLGPDADRAFPEQVAAVDKDEILRVARRIIDLNTYTLAVVRP
ncbi:MAG: insulinase family protein [Deltaproteobacteria bacterium]|nr:insulinase family protein [Deltaproteobacteria bacterium]